MTSTVSINKGVTCGVNICKFSRKAPGRKRLSRHVSQLSISTYGHGGTSSLTILKTKKAETLIAAHFLSGSQIEHIYDTNLKTGHTEERAAQQLLIDGPNSLPLAPDLTLWRTFCSNMFGWFPMLLWFAGFLAIGIHFLHTFADTTHQSYENLYLGGIILAVVFFTGFFGFYQEAKNYHVMKGFKDLIPLSANVIRNGQLKIVPVSELVIGDLVEMNAGEVVPADVRLIEVNHMRIDLSSITGEAEPVSRSIENTNDNPLETKNLAFFSCMITEGSAKGIVVATGENTVIGRIATLATGLEKEETPIAIEIKRFLKILCFLAFFLGGIFFILVTIIQANWIAGFYYMTGIIIANVPEGLLVTLTVSLTLTAKKLQNVNCLVKKLQSVETLGAVSCICSDKTGTLTQNCMSASHIVCNSTIYEAENVEFDKIKGSESFALAACLNLRAYFIDYTNILDPKAQIRGDASEKAVLRFMQLKYNATYVRDQNPKVYEIPFNSATKNQLSIHLLEGLQSHIMIMKGAPEVVIDFCISLNMYGETVVMSEVEKNNIKSLCIQLGRMGERVLAYSDYLLPDDEFPFGYPFDSDKNNFPVTGFRFIGLVSLIDPPRPSVPSAIAKCRSAGIKVMMITGDHPITALEISRKVGIISKDSVTPYDDAFKQNIDPKIFCKNIDSLTYNAVVVTGDELRHMTAAQLDVLIENVDEVIFARTSPQQKLIIVESCQRIGHVVGVTGDGVNDSPALKKADIGIAMGITGTDVSKQAADMILLDDDFSSIILGVENGRKIFDNLKKCIAFTLTSNLPEMVPFILYATIGIPLPLHALLIICINVLTDLWPAISLAYEKAEADIMSKPPRDLQNDRLVTWRLVNISYFQIGVFQVIAALTAYFIAMASYGFSPSSLLFTRNRWNSVAVNDFQDDFGQEWSYLARKSLESLAQSTYYASIVVVQIADLIICKTRRRSLLQQGMSNHMLNAGIVFEIGITLVILYVPVCNQILYTRPLPWMLWLPSIPFAFLIIFVDELRRYLIRKYPGGWVERELYW